jgi:hypothetical protein
MESNAPRYEEVKDDLIAARTAATFSGDLAARAGYPEIGGYMHAMAARLFTELIALREKADATQDY